MDCNDERSIVPVNDDIIIGGCRTDQGNNVASVLTSNRLTIKIDSLCIKLGIVKKTSDHAEKCRHFSIRGYVDGMRETGNTKFLPFTEQLPPMDIPNFRYWRCQGCLQNIGTQNHATSHETTPLVSVCDQRMVRSPSARPCPPQDCDQVLSVLPSGEGTSGLNKTVDSINNDESQEIPKFVSIDTNYVAAPGKKDINELKTHEEPQKTSIVKETITSPVSQPIESDHQNDNFPYGHPRRKARKVRLLKELMCKNIEIQQHKKENSSQIKRKMLHDHDQKSVDCKKPKTLKKSVSEHSRNPVVASEVGETVNNKYQWKNKHATQRNDAMTAWRSIFSDMRRTDNQVVTPTYGVSKGRGTEPYSNFTAPPKSNKKVNACKNISSNPLKSMKDPWSNTELRLGLNLNYDSQTNVRSQPSILNQDHSRKTGFFFGESSNFAHRIPSDVSNRQVSYGSCSGHQKLDFSDPYKRNIGIRGYSDVTRHHNNHQRQENTFSIKRSDEREIIELMAKNQYERSHFSHSGRNNNNNGIIPNATGFRKFNNINQEMTSSSHHEYLTMTRPTSTNVGPTNMRNPSFTMLDGLTQSQSQQWSGNWNNPRHHYVSKGNNNILHTRFHSHANMQVPETYNNYHNGSHRNETVNRSFGQTYAKYLEKEKGKNMMDLDLDLNRVAPNVVEDQNILESLDLMSRGYHSYSNEAIPAMQLLSLMDAGKSSQPFSNSQCRSTMVNPHFTYSGPRPSVQNPVGKTSFSRVVQTRENVKLTSNHGQHVYYEKYSRGYRPEEYSYNFPLPWNATEDRNKMVNGVFGSGFGSSGTEICTINRNPADFSTPEPENMYMIDVEDMIYNGKSASRNVNGPKWQKINKVW